ncbi:MAG: MoaD/ThiS family protein [Hyphomicrobiales bacterium]
MKVLYFARFRQLIGRGADEITPPVDVTTVGALLDYLIRTDNGCAAAFTDEKIIRAAVDQQHAKMSDSIVGAREVAFFPPVTGG